MKLKVLQVGPVPPDWGGRVVGGVAKQVQDLSIYLAKEGYEVTILTDFQKKNVLLPKGISLVQAPKIKSFKIFLSIFKFNTLVKSDNFFRRVILSEYLEILDRLDIDIIHIHSLHNIILDILPLMKNKKPSIITDHGFWQSRRSSIKLIKKRIENSDRVIYISEYSKAKAIEANIFSKKFIKIENPINTRRLKTLDKKKARALLGFPLDKKMIFFNGYTESIRRKGLDILLDALLRGDNLLKRNFFLVAIVDNEGREFLSKYKNQNIYILGKQDWDRIQLLYSASDVMVLPSRSESFGLVYIESLLMRCPVIGFSSVIEEFKSNLREIPTENILYSFDNKGDNYLELKKNILSASNEEVSEIQYKVIKRIYSWDRNIYKFIKLYEDTNQETN